MPAEEATINASAASTGAANASVGGGERSDAAAAAATRRPAAALSLAAAATVAALRLSSGSPSVSSLYLLIHEYLTPAPCTPGLAMVYQREAGSFQNHNVEEELSGPTAV